MVTYPQTGTYAAQDLPADDMVLFRAWQFLGAHRSLLPQAHQGDFSLKIAKRLLALGERRPAVNAAALLAVMPRSVSTLIARNVAPDVPAIVEDYGLHTRTRFAYIDQAGPATQKIAVATMMNMMADLQAKGDAEIEKIAAADEHGTSDGKIRLSFLAPPRDFLLAADKIQGTTGNSRLENIFADTALEYHDYHQKYLEQLLGFRIVQKSMGQKVAALLQGDPLLPRLDQTAIPVSEETHAAYAQISMDPRVPFDHACNAIRMAEIIADSGETAPDLLAAALFQVAYPVISAVDEDYLSKLGNGVTAAAVDIIRDNIDFMKTAAPLAYGPLSLRQLELAKTIAALRDGQMFLDGLQAQLDGPLRAASADARQTYAAKALISLQSVVQDLKTGILGDADALDCGVLADEAKAQMRLLGHMIERTGNDIGLGGLRPRSQKPADPSKGGPGL